jgi:hypothetical protein
MTSVCTNPKEADRMFFKLSSPVEKQRFKNFFVHLLL